jgi:ketosteroid isomerase-like protein
MIDVRAFFAGVDAMDMNAMAGLLANDAVMVFGNSEPMISRDAIVAGNRAFLETITGIRHRVLDDWTVGATTIAQTEVTYARPDGKEVTIPAATFWRTNDAGLLSHIQVYLDLAPLFAR